MPPAAPSRVEFIALMAMLFATIAFSTDAMLPGLPQIGADLTPDNLNAAQLVVTSFVLGMGLGTLVTGPLSDAFGRKPVILAGAALYIVAAAAAAVAQSLEIFLAARVLQGLGASGPRVVALAIIRDLYSGRGMARIMSFVMMVFTLVPALAPSIGALVIALSGWRAIFVAFILFALVASLWLAVRLPETHPPEARQPLRLSVLSSALAEVFAHPVVRISIGVQTLSFAMLFSFLSSTQQIFDLTFGQGDTFHLWFGAIAVVSASGSLLNARIVMRLGMQAVVRNTLIAQVALSGLFCLILMAGLSGQALFVAFLIWKTSVFFQAALTIGNINAIAMEPMGHIAGMAASAIGSVATVASLVLAVPVGLMFDGTPLPLAAATFVFSILAVAGMRLLARSEAQTAA